LVELLPYLSVVGAVLSFLAYWLKLRFLRHALDKRGTRAAVELANALRVTPRRLPGRRRDDGGLQVTRTRLRHE
jgi:hypothetical protein